MTRRKNAEVTVDADAENALSEFFASDNDARYIDYNLLEFTAIGRVIVAVTQMGGSVAFYGRGADNGLKLFVRVGQRSKSYQFDSEEQWNELIDAVCNPWLLAYGRFLAIKQPPKPISIGSEKPSKPRKQSK